MSSTAMSLNRKRSRPTNHGSFHDFVRIKSIHLTLMSPEEIRAMSVTNVNKIKNYNKQLPVPGSVNCPRMGSMDRRVDCMTCVNDNKDCPGHFGKIELPAPFYFPGFIKETLAVLRTVCKFCCRILVEEDDFKVAAVLCVKDEAYSATDRTFKQITDLAKNKKKCPHCDMPQPIMTIDGPNIKWDWSPDVAVELANIGIWSTCGRPFNAADALSILGNVPDEDYSKMGLDIVHSHPKWAIMTVMPVVPNSVRPSIMASEGSNTRGPDDLTFILKRIVQYVHEIRETMVKIGIKKQDKYTTMCSGDLPEHLKIKRKGDSDANIETDGVETDEKLKKDSNLRKVNMFEWANTSYVEDVLEDMDVHLVPDGDFVALMWEKMPKLMEKLQQHIVAFVNNEGKIVPQVKQRSGTPMKTLINRLNTKSGRVRGHLMGKRMDFSGRSVITPGADLDITEIGVPAEMAMILTIPEVVNHRNILSLQESVRKGPRVLNGANRILCQDGRVVYLEYLDSRDKLTIEMGWIVERHLRDGDPILFNRQPSLHRMSLMGFKAKILPHSHAFQLNLCCTTAFNADFDGDEMNIHVCQNIRALAETRRLMGVQYQIISPQNSTPIVSLVQNGLIGSYLMTANGVFFTKEDMCQYVESIKYLPSVRGEPYNKSDRSILPPPAVLKPVQLWTGRQLYSMLFPPDLNVSFQWTDMPATTDQNDTALSSQQKLNVCESKIVVRNGEIMTGRITKKAVGMSANNIVSAIYHDNGPTVASEFLSDASRLMDNYICRRGFSMGIDDCMVSKPTRKKINTIMQDMGIIHNSLEKFQHVKKFMCAEDKADVEAKVHEMIGCVIQRASAHVFNEQTMSGVKNSMVDMIESGAKGKRVNLTNLTVAVGQQIIEGTRPKPGPTGRTLPCFSTSNKHPETRGFIAQSYVEGLEPHSMFAHFMGGREGLVDTAVKTADTGYLQRQIVKAMEACILSENKCVMDENRTIVQFRYGEDGIDPMCAERCPFEWISYSNDQLRDMAKLDPSSKINTGWYQMMFMTRNTARSQCMTVLFPEPPTMAVLPFHIRRILRDRYGMAVPSMYSNSCRDTDTTKSNVKLVTSRDVSMAFTLIRNTCMWMRDIIGHEGTVIPRLSLMCELSPKNMKRYGLTFQDVEDIVCTVRDKYMLSIAQTGETVGIIAAQSVGEPTTQMTLNTFHLAGQGSKKLSLGVPRFCEIVKMSPSPSTPFMSLAIRENNYDVAKKVCQLVVSVPLESVTCDPFVVYDPACTSDEGPTTCIKSHLEIMDHTASVYGREADQAVPGTWELSPYVICMELKRDVMQDKELTPGIVAKAIESAWMSTPMIIIYSEVNAPMWVVRIRPVNMSNEIEVRSLPVKIMSKVMLGGIKGIDYAEPSEINVPVINDETGEIEYTKEWRVEAQGSSFDADRGTVSSSFLACAQIPMVDWTRSYTNHIMECNTVLGISACRSLILKELNTVLTADGSYVDIRHIQLLADNLTFRGYPMTTTRHGQNKTERGPLIRASFEGTADVLHRSAYFADEDHMLGFTQNLMVGQIPPIGTGMFGIQCHDPPEKVMGNTTEIGKHSVLSRLSELEPKWKSRIDRETGVVIGSHHCAQKKRALTCDKDEPKKLSKRVRFNTTPITDNLEHFMEHAVKRNGIMHKSLRKKNTVHASENSVKDIQDSDAIKMGAYASIASTDDVWGCRKNCSGDDDDSEQSGIFVTTAKKLQMDLFDSEGVSIVNPIIIRPVRGETYDDMVRNLYEEYLETLRTTEGYHVPDIPFEDVCVTDVHSKNDYMCNDYINVAKNIQRTMDRQNMFRVSTPIKDVHEFCVC